MRVRIHRNARTADRPFFKYGRLPVRQHLFWIGPLFVLVQR